MKAGWLIFLDSLLNFIVYSNFLTVYKSYYSYRLYLCGQLLLYSNFFIVVFLFYY